MAEKEKLLKYLQEKKKLEEKKLTHQEYEAEIKKIIKKLKL